MGTRSNIGFLERDGSAAVIYCHWDGYPDWNGKILSENYNSFEKLLGLMQLWDISSLGKTLEETVAYHRDRGEKRSPWRTYKSVAEVVYKGEGHIYLWDIDRGKWMYCRRGIDLTPLEDILDKDQ